MSDLFYGAAWSNEDISRWEVGQVKYMNYMFHSASSFNGDFSRWNAPNELGEHGRHVLWRHLARSTASLTGVVHQHDKKEQYTRQQVNGPSTIACGEG